MKIKNITTDEKQLTERGKIVILQAGEIREFEKPKFDRRSFKIIVQRKARSVEKTIKSNGGNK